MSYTGAELPYDVLATIARALTESATPKECVDYALVCKAFREGIQERIFDVKWAHTWDVPYDDERTVEAERMFEELIDSLEPGQGLEDWEVEELVYEAYSSDDIDEEWMDNRVTATARIFLNTRCSFCERCDHHFPKHEVVWYKRACVPTTTPTFRVQSACANCREVPEVRDAVADEEHAW